MKRKLAEGGMAELYLAAAKGPEGFEKEVVVKLIKAFLLSDQTFIEMFKQEARLASRLNHPNVVQIFDFDRHEDAWFIAMEYVHGASLWDLRRRCRELAVPFPATLVAEIGAQVARGLHYAHTLTEKGKPLALVHRDVTPHNVLLSYDGSVKLTDFGIAKAGTSFTAPGMLKGKFAYMSPEQARGERVDARTDVFAMGITLWEMLTGGRLFEGDSDIAVLRAVQESLIAPPSRLNSDVPQELSEVVLKALARPLDARFQSAQELERSLTNFVLKNAQSGDDTNVGLFLRQMFRDELEEAERAEFTGPGTNPSSQTPIIDTYALGNTVASARNAPDAHTQQTATPSVPGPVKTAQQPGLRISRPLSPLMDEDDGSAQRTDQMDELAPREKTAQQRVSVKRLPFVAAPEPAPTPMPLPAAAPEAPVETPAAEAPKSSLLPWILAACLAVGLVGGLSIAITRGPPAVQPPPSAIELPLVVKAPPLPPPLAPPTLPAPPPLPAPAPVAVVAEPKPAPVEPPPVRPPVPEPVAVKPEEPKPPQPTPSVEPAANPVPRGWLEVSARPFATLSIDGKPFGEITGVRRIQVPPGPHSLVFIHPRLKETKPVTVKAGQTTTVKFEWVPK